MEDARPARSDDDRLRLAKLWVDQILGKREPLMSAASLAFCVATLPLSIAVPVAGRILASAYLNRNADLRLNFDTWDEDLIRQCVSELHLQPHAIPSLTPRETEKLLGALDNNWKGEVCRGVLCRHFDVKPTTTPLDLLRHLTLHLDELPAEVQVLVKPPLEAFAYVPGEVLSIPSLPNNECFLKGDAVSIAARWLLHWLEGYAASVADVNQLQNILRETTVLLPESCSFAIAAFTGTVLRVLEARGTPTWTLPLAASHFGALKALYQTPHTAALQLLKKHGLDFQTVTRDMIRSTVPEAGFTTMDTDSVLAQHARNPFTAEGAETVFYSDALDSLAPAHYLEDTVVYNMLRTVTAPSEGQVIHPDIINVMVNGAGDLNVTPLPLGTGRYYLPLLVRKAHWILVTWTRDSQSTVVTLEVYNSLKGFAPRDEGTLLATLSDWIKARWLHVRTVIISHKDSAQQRARTNDCGVFVINNAARIVAAAAGMAAQQEWTRERFLARLPRFGA